MKHSEIINTIRNSDNWYEIIMLLSEVNDDFPNGCNRYSGSASADALGAKRAIQNLASAIGSGMRAYELRDRAVSALNFYWITAKLYWQEQEEYDE